MVQCSVIREQFSCCDYDCEQSPSQASQPSSMRYLPHTELVVANLLRI